jgi:predicted TIM-barrel fold metal-dependent hydrolase
MVWGSDWPHTSFEVDRMPGYQSTLAPVRQALDTAPSSALPHEHAGSVYF